MLTGCLLSTQDNSVFQQLSSFYMIFLHILLHFEK